MNAETRRLLGIKGNFTVVAGGQGKKKRQRERKKSPVALHVVVWLQSFRLHLWIKLLMNVLLASEEPVLCGGGGEDKQV